jgi:hypothetical protein
MDEEIYGEGWKHLSKSKILPKRKTTYRQLDELPWDCGLCAHPYNISGGVANIFYQSCAQIDNNQHIFRCQDVKYLKGRFTRMSKAQATSS